MQKEQLTLLALIRSALWGDAPPDDPGAALNIAREQMLMPLLFPDTPEAGSCTAHSVRLLFAEDGAIALFRSAGIDAVVLKGAAAACLYPDPLRRTMGDVDLIVPPDMFDDACCVFDENGYRRGSDTPFSYKDFPNNIMDMFAVEVWRDLFLKELITKNNIRFQNLETCNDNAFNFIANVYK